MMACLGITEAIGTAPTVVMEGKEITNYVATNNGNPNLKVSGTHT
jgi:hypothetical protein